MFPGRFNYEYKYFSYPTSTDSLGGYRLKQYDSMLDRLNRENEELSRNVVELIKENTRLKTQVSHHFIDDCQPRNRSNERNVVFTDNVRYASPPPKKTQKMEIPSSAKMTTNQSKTQITFNYPRSFKTVSPQKMEVKSPIQSFWSTTQSPTFIDQLSEEKFQNRDKERQNSLSKIKKGLQLSKKMVEHPLNGSSMSFSDIQVEETADIKKNREIQAKLHDFHRQEPVNPKQILEQLKEGLREVRSRFHLQEPERRQSYSPAREVKNEVYLTYEEQKHRQPATSAYLSKKDNRPYTSVGSNESLVPPVRPNQAYLSHTPKFSYSPARATSNLSRHYY